MNIRCEAVINDPVGALMAGAFDHDNCTVGLILGTGTNCCYMERLDNVHRWDQDFNDPKQVCSLQYILTIPDIVFRDPRLICFVKNMWYCCALHYTLASKLTMIGLG